MKLCVNFRSGLSRAKYDYQTILNMALIHIDAQYLPDIAVYKSEEAIVNRLSDEHWWRRALRKQRKRTVDGIGAISI